MTVQKITTEQARWTCDPNQLGFVNTRELEPQSGILGQQDAIDALHFGLETRIHGNNVFVRGLSGFGRMSLIDQMIKESDHDAVVLPDQCYVHNFVETDQPKLIEVDCGKGKAFQRAMEGFAEFAQTDLPLPLRIAPHGSVHPAWVAGPCLPTFGAQAATDRGLCEYTEADSPDRATTRGLRLRKLPSDRSI